MRPLIVVENTRDVFDEAVAEVQRAGWTVVPGWWTSNREQIVCSGVVASPEDAAAALLAAVGGAGLIVDGRADRGVLDRLCDDLRRLGVLDHRTSLTPRAPRLTAEEHALVDLLLDGLTLGEAAQRLYLSRRTADRRMGSVREKLGVKTTAEALVHLRRRQT